MGIPGDRRQRHEEMRPREAGLTCLLTITYVFRYWTPLCSESGRCSPELPPEFQEPAGLDLAVDGELGLRHPHRDPVDGLVRSADPAAPAFGLPSPGERPRPDGEPHPGSEGNHDRHLSHPSPLHIQFVDVRLSPYPLGVVVEVASA